MADTVQGLVVEVKIYGSITGDDGTQQRVNINERYEFTEGTGANNLGSWFYDPARALNATSEDLDLNGGLTDFQGVNMALNNVKIIYAKNRDTDTGDTLTFGEGSSNTVSGPLGGTSPTVTIQPSGLFLWIDPNGVYPVTGGSADEYSFTTADNSTYDVLIAGDNA